MTSAPAGGWNRRGGGETTLAEGSESAKHFYETTVEIFPLKCIVVSKPF